MAGGSFRASSRLAPSSTSIKATTSRVANEDRTLNLSLVKEGDACTETRRVCVRIAFRVI